MFTKKSTSRLLSVLPSVVMTLAVLIGSVAFPTNARAFSNTIQVTTTADNTVHDSVCSLREAITNANDNAATYTECIFGAGSLVIGFDTGLGTATIPLTSALPDITHTTGLIIDGGGHITINGSNSFRVFSVIGGVTFTLRNLTITNGKAISLCSSASDGNGGAVRNEGSLTITNSTISNNNATTSAGCGGNGGGVYNIGTATITSSTFSGNNAALSGGGIYNGNGGTTTITMSTFLSNVANSGYGGGGVFNFGTLNIANSTFALDSGAGVSGGALYTHTGTATLTNNTFSYNSTTVASGGGDIYNYSSTLNLYNNILANSLGGGDCVNNILGTVNAGYNINEDVTNGCNLPIGPGGNYIGSDPGLSSLYASAYFPLFPSSLAIDKGDDTKCGPASPVNNTSQNGLTRPQGLHCDIGSYEGDYVPPTVLSSVRANPNPTSASSVNFTVTFSESVSGVDAADFTLITTGSISGALVTNAIGSGVTSTVTVNTGSGNGTIRLDVMDNDTIVDGTSNPLGGSGTGNGNFTTGQAYSVDKTFHIYLPLVLR